MTREEFIRQAELCGNTMYRVASAYLKSGQDRADAAQNALLKAWKNKDALKDERYFKTWLVRILIRECVNLQRRYHPNVPLEGLELPTPPARDPALHDAIEHLPPALKIPVLLYYLEGYSLKEAALALRLPQGTVKSRLSRARKILRDELKEDIE